MTLVDLVSVSGRELGLTDNPVIDALYCRATELGLNTVPAETGRLLLLSTGIMRAGDSFHIGMEPIVDLDGYLRVFEISCYDHGRYIGAANFRPTYRLGIDIRWIFMR